MKELLDKIDDDGLEKELNQKVEKVKKELNTEKNNYKKSKPTPQETLDKRNEDLTNLSFDIIKDLLQFSFDLMEQTYKSRSGNYLNNDLMQLYLKLVEYRRKIQGKVGTVKLEDRNDIIRLKKDFLNSIKNSSIKLKNPYLKKLLKEIK